MKSLLPLLSLIFVAQAAFTQCDELFFSEYVEGYSSNKALEVYNPTDAAVNLSDYSIARASNGSTAPASNQIISLPDVMLEPYDVFVVVVDLRDTSLWDSQFDKPVWNGYNVIDTIIDVVTGEPVRDNLGNIILGPQYSSDGSALFGDEYNEEYDMQCKADAFLCPDYDQNNTMYFNGNDAMILLKGSQISPNGENILDVIGVIGEDPEQTIMEDAWVNEDGFWLTKNRTLVRNEEVSSGNNDLSKVVFALGGTFTGEEWASYPNNSFEYLGIHSSVCNNENKSSLYSCSEGEISSLYSPVGINFRMFPNPNSAMTLSLESDKAFQWVEIYDMMGRRLSMEKLGTDVKATKIQLNGLNAGIYIVKLGSTGENNWAIRQLIIE